MNVVLFLIKTVCNSPFIIRNNEHFAPYQHVFVYYNVTNAKIITFMSWNNSSDCGVVIIEYFSSGKVDNSVGPAETASLP